MERSRGEVEQGVLEHTRAHSCKKLSDGEDLDMNKDKRERETLELLKRLWT